MSQFLHDLIGLMGSYLKLGGPGGPRMANNAGAIEIQTTAGTAFATARAKNLAAGGGNNDLATLLDLKGRIPLISFSFNGSGPPAPGANTGLFGFCHTTNGGYTQGRVYYDDGVSLVLMPTEVVRALFTSTAVTGAISLIANGCYTLQAGSWVIKGDGSGSSTGVSKTIEVPFTFADKAAPVDSTTSVTDGSRVLDTRLLVEAALDGAATLLVTINGGAPLTLMPTAGNEPTVINEYQVQTTQLITAANEGLVRVTVGGNPTVGSGRALVTYCTPMA